MEFPLIGGIAFAVILSVIIEVLKALGVWSEEVAPWVNVIGGVVWAFLVLLIGQFPESETWIVLILKIIVLLASVPVGSQTAYRFIVKPITKKRFNKCQGCC